MASKSAVAPQKPAETHKPSYARSLVEKLVAGAIAGIIGSTATFPLDLVKTRLQNQSVGPNGEQMYKNMVDCFMQSLRKDGVSGLYRGLPAVLVGITPEKAIKLGMNDFLCELFRQRLQTDTLPFTYLALCGGLAGFSQFVATNPMEIVKINMQIQGQPGFTGPQHSMGQVVRELGFRGLYKGASATLLRDIPFSVIYFGLYGYLKQKLTAEDGSISPGRVFLTAFGAGTVAAAASTPADVIKTRIQAKPKPGEVPFKGIADCFNRTVAEGGYRALLRGVGPRIIVISPLFGIALVVYEVQKKIIAQLGI